MKTCQFVFFVIHLNFASFHFVDHLQSTDKAVEKQLKIYFKSYKTLKRNYSLCNYINVKSLLTQNIANWWIKFNKCPSFVTQDFSNTSNITSKGQVTFVFLDANESINKTINNLKTLQFCDSRKEIHFIISTKIIKDSFLNSMLNFFWKQHILNFVVVYFEKKLKIVTFNPFKNLTIFHNIPLHYNDLFQTN